jgi:hypothetical protein
VLGFAAATAAMATAYIRVIGAAAGAAAEFCGPMAKQQRMFVVTVTALACGTAAMFGATVEAGGYGVPALALALITAGSVLTPLRRLLRIARTLRGRA